MKAKASLWGYILPLLFLGTASCMRDNFDVPSTGDEQHLVKFSIAVPGNTNSTRALSEAGESHIETIDVLMFKVPQSGDVFYDSKLVFIAKCDQITGTGSQRQFEVLLLGENNIKLVVLANSRQLIGQGGLNMGMSYSQAAELITLSKDDKWVEADGDYIPMWGQSPTVIDITANMVINDIKLVRMVSKIDVQLTHSDATDNFKMETVRLYNFYTRGTVIPDVSDWPTDNVADKPHLPDASLFSDPIVSDESDVLLFDATDDGLMADGLEYAIYTFEAPAGSASTLSKNTCLIIGGEYKDGNVYYYRVDFVESDGSVDKYLPLKRNFLYQVMITGVYGPGYDTPEEALKSAPVNIHADVLSWEESTMTYFAFDGQTILGASHKEFKMTANEQSAARQHILSVTTNYAGGWQAKITRDFEGQQEVTGSWLTISSPSGSAVNYPQGDNITLTATENTGIEDRTLYIQVTAGRLTLPVTVTQTAIKDGYLLFETLTGDALEDLIFVGEENDIPASKYFYVRWFPASAAVTLTYTEGTPAFSRSGIEYHVGGVVSATAPTTINLGGSNDDTAEAQFLANPLTSIGQLGLSEDFIQKVVQVQASITVSGETHSQKLNIRQSNVNIVTDADNLFLILDGTKQSFAVRSSVDWKIKSVNDPDGVVGTFDQSQYGTYNIAKGTPVYLSLVNRMSPYVPTESEVEVWFEWYDENAQQWKDWPTPAVLKCVTAERQVGANSYMTDPTDRRPIFIPIYEHVSRAMDGIAATNSIGDAKLETTWLLPSDGAKWGAAVLWSDRDITSSSYVVEDVRFTGDNRSSISMVNDAGIIVMPGNIEGNAVVILYDDVNANGRYDVGVDYVKWSWHIWSTRYHPEYALGTISKPTSMSENGYVTATGMNGRVHKHHTGYQRSNIFMDRNLGSTPYLSGDEGIDFGNGDADKVLATYGLHYQWGRKDPFIGPANNASAAPPSAPIYSKEIDNPAVGTVAVSTTNNLANSIYNPLTFYTGSDWYTNNNTYQNHYLWGNGTNTNDAGHVKTVFDPCPPGWRVPLSSTDYNYSAWSRSPNETSTTPSLYTSYSANFTSYKGYFFDDGTYNLGYYPAAGYRNYNTVAFANVTTGGFWWSASQAASSATYTSYLLISSTSVNPFYNTSRGTGFSVRCVAE